MSRKEWKKYQNISNEWISQYERVPDLVDVATGRKSLIDWTPVSILVEDFNEKSKLNPVDTRTIGGLLRELKRKRSDEYDWLSTNNQKWNLTKKIKKEFGT